MIQLRNRSDSRRLSFPRQHREVRPTRSRSDDDRTEQDVVDTNKQEVCFTGSVNWFSYSVKSSGFPYVLKQSGL